MLFQQSNQVKLTISVAALPFMASEGAETMDKLFHGTVRTYVCSSLIPSISRVMPSLQLKSLKNKLDPVLHPVVPGSETPSLVTIDDADYAISSSI